MTIGEKLLNLRKQNKPTPEQLGCDLNVPIQNLVSDEQYTFFNYGNSGGNNGCVNVNYPEKWIKQYDMRFPHATPDCFMEV
ncbi:MAG: hypothetical protein LBB84_07145 [Tannerellaceae bacterium]|jgi:hypothetical protein|nr:hypothetical protein [Tannerellaceae bacterium]